MHSLNERKQYIMKALCVIVRNANVKVCIAQTVKGAVICGAMSFVGGLLLGPVGLAIGGTIGGITACVNSEEFLPLHQALETLTEREKLKLIEHVEKAVAEITLIDFFELIKIYLENGGNLSFKIKIDIKNTIIKAIVKYFREFLRVQVSYA